MRTTHKQAETRVRRGLLAHLAVYVLVVSGLVALNYTRSPDKLWTAWMAGGWGIGLLVHAASYLFNRERMIERTEHRMDQKLARY